MHLAAIMRHGALASCDAARLVQPGDDGHYRGHHAFVTMRCRESDIPSNPSSIR
jgi:hypothetical protein